MYPAPSDVVARVQDRVEVLPDGCWYWPGATSVGYGRIRWVDSEGQQRWGATHRVMYASLYGAIPDGFDVDHQCHDPEACQPERAVDCPHRRCCNPDHLKAMSRRDNLLRGGTIAAKRAAITECPRGHPYDEANTLIDTKGRRSCKECTYERNRAYYHRNKERRKAYNRAWYARRKEQP